MTGSSPPKQLAERLGLELRVKDGPEESDSWPIADVTVDFFKEGDPDFSFVARDGALIPRGVPVEAFRDELSRNGGVYRLPDGTAQGVTIPDGVRDGESFHVRVAVTRLKSGAQSAQRGQDTAPEQARRGQATG